MVRNQVRYSYEDYTVAVICPMGVELAPVLAMLDEQHPPIQSQQETCGHTLGRIGDHLVVISVLPEIGTNRAATISAQLVRDFPSIRFGLLVGIGGGVPSPADPTKDIRLGDVVVSKPTNGNPGVIQFDMGKIEAGQRFRKTGYLAKPPPTLLTAIEMIVAKFEMEGPKLHKGMEMMLQHHPAMTVRYSYQGAGNDVLFKSTYEHSAGDTCELCDEKKQVRRVPRSSTEPRIFFGLIGSSNAVVKDGTYREMLEEEGLLCVEMEAAGMMDNFGCLVIRGICDYADSHKNKRWQPYAAATAAAFMKELLAVIPHVAVRKTEKVINTIKDPVPEHLNKIWTLRRGPPKAFTGREEAFDRIAKCCRGEETDTARSNMLVVAIFGQGGSGKTSLCLKYAWDFRDEYYAVFWVDASSESLIRASLQRGYRSIFPGRQDDIDEMVQWISNLDKPWLMILDNADNKDLDYASVLPFSARGTIIVTSRGQFRADFTITAKLHLKEMQAEEACRLLFAHAFDEGRVVTKREREDAMHLVALLGYLPLAIVSAGSYLQQRGCQIHEYQTVVAQVVPEAPPPLPGRHDSATSDTTSLASASMSDVSQPASSQPVISIDATLEVAVSHIKSLKGDNMKDALAVMDFLSFIHFDGISEDIFYLAFREALTNPVVVKGSSLLGPQAYHVRVVRSLRSGDSSTWDSIPFRNAINLLASLSIVSNPDDSFKNISVHPRVHAWIVERVAVDGSRGFKRKKPRGHLREQLGLPVTAWYDDTPAIRATATIEECLIQLWNAQDSYWDDFRSQMVSHTETYCRRVQYDFGRYTLISTGVRVRIAALHAAHGDQDLAMNICRPLIGAKPGKIWNEKLEGLLDVSLSFHSGGRYQLATTLIESLWQGLGDENFDFSAPDWPTKVPNRMNYSFVVKTSRYFASLLLDTWRINDARLHAQYWYNTFSVGLGSTIPDTVYLGLPLLEAYLRSGHASYTLGMATKIVSELRTAEKWDEQYNFTRETLPLLHMRAHLDCHDYENALSVGTQFVSQIETDAASPQALPWPFVEYYVLALAQHQQWERAAGVTERSWLTLKRRLRPAHPARISLTVLKACVHYHQGDIEEATKLAQTCLTEHRQFGLDDYPQTLHTMFEFTTLLDKIGKTAEAADLAEKSFEVRRTRLGGHNPFTLQMMHNLGRFWATTDRRSQALELFESLHVLMLQHYEENDRTKQVEAWIEYLQPSSLPIR
ncbi:Hypothetical protein D9617_32g092030 [Elsinoe fawcettii]|nr:Hypothetical protein D9617_32g092030 [Elsinoe fawcettii]